MRNLNKKAQIARHVLGKRLDRFAREEEGLVTVFACCMIFMMLIVGGMGVDLMRNEMERVKIQNTVDRAVLAAADLDQTLDPEDVIRDYFAKSRMPQYVGSISVNEGLSFRTACVYSAPASTPTQFMRLVGVDTLPLTAGGCAEERMAKVEISLVLDISGSMKNNNKLPNLRQAANVFIDTVIRPETHDNVSLSLVPYSEQVNAGPDLMSKFNVNQRHSFSHCMEIDNPSDYHDTALDRTIAYDQTQHYQFNRWSNSNTANNSRTDTVCPRYSYERITPFSQDATALKDQINQFKPRAGTSIFLGMKWGVGMLDPDFRPVTNNLIGEGKVDAAFAPRPANWTDNETLKTVILMTDGKNSSSWRILDRYYREDSHYVHWNRYNYQYYMQQIRRPWESWLYRRYTPGSGDAYLDSVCDAAKLKGIVIWTIAFETDEHGRNVMRDCASSPSHHFSVEGVDITEAFRAIARQINQLRLTQ